ncbi:protocadherin-9-like [Littorina saxatilis]|uniref:Protocadherin-20 n=1 Tax=Littorina saxatilis TaxID=31220 RepID=A0AAN9B0K5_9CAEN
MKKMLTSCLLLFALMTLISMTSAQSADVEIRINEEEQEGTFVVNISEYPTLFLEVAEEDRQKLAFDILDKSSFDASFFRMNSATGVVSIAKRLDRESVCDASVNCALEFNVAIQGKDGLSFSNIASVKVFVDDINDNSPNFPADQVVLEISEGAKVGTVLKLSGPQDLDSLPNNTIQRYDLTLNEPVFSISDTKNPDGSSFLYLKLEKDLDRETKAEYDFNIIAYDGGDPPRSDFLRVIIQVTDENDNAPKFESNAYNVNIREDTAVGSDVVRVRATDRDSGVFGRVEYRFSSKTSDAINSLFEINSTSGVVKLKARVEHTTGDTPYTVVVEAFDGGSPPSVVQTVATINVLNTGNNAPIVRIVTVSEGDTTEVSLSESAKRDDFVAFVNVEDTDEGSNGDVTCSLVNSGQFRLAELPNKGYKILLSGDVDREAVSSYDAAILCSDGGSPSLSTETPFTVVITDVNDNDPKFDLVGYATTVTENNAAGQYLLQVTATDKDSGDNSAITYGFLEPEALTFLSIHPQSGLVTARVPLDRENTPVLMYTLTAVDGGAEPRTGTARLTLTVRDANDNTPQLQGTPYRFTVSEGATAGHVVAVLSATDVDEGQNGQVDFFFAGSVNGEVPFTVHTNGTIEVTGVLDRETSDSYVFTVLARDKGTIPKSNSTQVTIRVTDINDNAPVILFPTNVNHSVVITTLPEEGIILGRVIAYDVDEGNASSLVYAIHSGDAEGVFSIDSETGKIFLADLNRLKNPFSYFVVLRVYDLGFPPLFAETRLQIEINFANVTDIDGLAGNQGNGGHKEESRDSYVIIVAVIGGATLVLSGIIIGAILFVLKSERKRKTRDNLSVLKNDYVPAPTKSSSAFDSDANILQSPERKYPESELSSSGVILSPKGLPPSQRPDAQKKVSFSLDEPDAEVRQFHAGNEMLLAVPMGHPPHHEASVDAWKRLASPDDMNSDTSGDSGTCDSGRGASDDDIHLDNSMDKRQ